MYNYDIYLNLSLEIFIDEMYMKSIHVSRNTFKGDICRFMYLRYFFFFIWD